MDKNLVIKALSKAKEGKKRNFKQSIDLIINLRGIDLKKPDQRIDNFFVLKYDNGKKIKVCGLVDKELIRESKENLDKIIPKEEFSVLNPKQIKKLAKEFDFFIAKATIMTDVAKYFGKFLGPKGKMPNPKAGCVVPPNANLKQLKERLAKTVKLQTKNEAIIKVMVGKEDMEDDKIAENILGAYNAVLGFLPQEKANVKNIMLKLTMGEAVLVEDGKDK